MNSSENDLKPLVSICIPVYNGEKYVEECINSVLSQDFESFELLILDNCSTDSTALIVSDIQDNRIRYIKNDFNIGSISNFNKGIELSSGVYFLLLPHDDLLLPGSLGKFVYILEDSSIGFVYSATQFIDENSEELTTKVNHTENQLFKTEEAIKDVVDHFVPIQLAITRTDIIKSMIKFDIEYGSLCDVQFWLKIIFNDWKTFYHSDPLSCHRVHSMQGQNAFMNSDIDTISHHWGKKLDKSFWKENSYNNLFLKLSAFILEEMARKSYSTNHIEKKLLKMFIRFHLRSIYNALIKIDGFILYNEVLTFKTLIKKHSLMRLLLFYPLILFKELHSKVCFKKNNLTNKVKK